MKIKHHGDRNRRISRQNTFMSLFGVAIVVTHSVYAFMPTPSRMRSTSSLRAKTPQYIRWKSTGDAWEMQTALTHFERHRDHKTSQRVDLHAQLHYGTAQYFDYFNEMRSKKYKKVLYELLVDENLLQTDPKSRLRFVPPADRSPLAPSPSDQATAAQYGWSCQVDHINYAQHDWIHADWTRQEFLQASQTTDNKQPLWQQAQSIPLAATEAVTALLQGPPSLRANENDQRRLFTNLFLPGNNFAYGLRNMLWFTVPAPEISILLLDWSSLLIVDRISKVALPILQALTVGRLDLVRQLVFGQVVLTGATIGSHNNKQQSDWNLLVTQRNDRAFEVLHAVLPQADRVALLYGCSHCPDLHTKLESLGFEATKTEWRTAWSVPIVVDVDNKTPNIISILLLLSLYFFVSGMDWIDTLRDIGNAINDKDALIVVINTLLYLGRHVLLYVSLSKFVLEWGGSREAN